MPDRPQTLLEYHNPVNATPKPFTWAAIRYALGIVLAATATWVFVRMARVPDDSLLIGYIGVIIGFPAFQAAWAIRNYRGAPLVERNAVLSVACGSGMLLGTVMVVWLLPWWMTNLSILGALSILLLPVVISTIAARLMFRRVTEAGNFNAGS